jgi:DNA mismatch repair protein MutS2
VHDHLAELRALLLVMAELDELYGRARLALRWNGVAVTLNEKGVVRILKGRHPLLLERLKDKVIPLSLELLPPLRMIVISGPNAGGKTVVLKTVGLFSLMAAAGLFVPASPGTELPFFRGIHADIGDAQSIESDLSTFTAHLGRLGRLVADVQTPKLVLVDEIGSSTDPALGSALAQAVMLELTRQQAVSLVTTHHGTLKAFAHDAAGMENGSMTFDEVSLQPTYVYRAGIPGSSYAFEIAQRVGFPQAILDTARGFMGTGQLGLEELVSELSKKLEAFEKLRRESDLKLTEYEALKKLYADKTKELKKIQAEIKARALAEAEAIIERTGRDMDAAIREIKKEQASKSAIHDARERILAAATEVSQRKEEVRKELAPDTPQRQRLQVVKVGDRVEFESMEGAGTVTGTQKNGQRVEVEIGGVRMWTDLSRLYAAVETKARAPRVEMRVDLLRPDVPLQLDLRGKYGDEAIPEVDSYLAAAAEANLKVVTIVHGKGTGALRVKVREFLDSHPLVKGYRDGGRENNDFGSTLVELKL